MWDMLTYTERVNGNTIQYTKKGCMCVCYTGYTPFLYNKGHLKEETYIYIYIMLKGWLI